MALPNLLSLNFLVPFVASKIDFSRAIRGLRGMPRRLLLIGHKAVGGVGVAPLNTILTVSTEAEAIRQVGEGSLLMGMWRAAKANADLGLPIDMICIAEGGSAVKASSVVAVTGSPGQTGGEVMLYVGGQRISVGVISGESLTSIAAKLVAAINAATKLPVTAATNATPGQVVVTARWGGPTGNDISLAQQYYQGDLLAIGLTMTTPAMTGGAVSPDVTPVIVAMAGYRATEIVCPFTDGTNMLLLESELATRWLANNMQDGMVINALRGTEAAITTYLLTRNSPHVHTIATTGDLTSPWETAAMAGADIESGAAIDPAQPQTGMLLLGYIGPRQGQNFTTDQVNNLLNAGGSPLQISQDGTGRLLRMVTNYTQTDAGAADRSMAEMPWLKTMSYYRWFRVTEFQTKYTGFKIAQYITDPIPGQKIMTKELGQEIMLGLYKLFMDAGLCQNLPYYQQTLIVEIDAPNGKLKILDEPVIVTQHYQTEITSAVVAGQV